MQNRAHLSIPGKSSNVGLARITAATFASELEFTLNELEEIKVAVSEAVTNCIIHAYPLEEGTIDINFEIQDNKLIIIVKDTGIGIKDIEAVLEPSYSTREDHMGLGLAFIDSFMDNFEIESQVNEGTVVKMIKVPEKSGKKVK